jgi:hypothetical protein
MGLIGTFKDMFGALVPGSGRTGAEGPARWAKGADDRPGEEEQRQGLMNQAQQAGDFANYGQGQFAGTTGEAQEARNYLRDLAMGKNSLSAEQLRQGLQQQQAQMQSMSQGGPASAAPMNARTAMLGAGRASSAMAGNQAMAGIAERNAAQKAWADAILGARQQDLQASLGSRQNAISGYGGITPGQSWLDSWGGAIMGGAGVAMGGKGR